MEVTYGDLAFERLGHASVRITTGDGRTVYVDPWSDQMDDDPAPADVVFVTHDDYDHYDPEAIEAVATDDTVVAAYEGVDTSDLPFETVSLGYDVTTTVAGIDVRTVPAYNDPDGTHVRDNGDPYHAEGEVVGLLLAFDGTTVYYASDTDFLDAHETLTADVFLPPIGGQYTMDREEAAAFAESVDPDLVLPVHYNTAGMDGIETDAEAFERDVEARGPSVELF